VLRETSPRPPDASSKPSAARRRSSSQSRTGRAGNRSLCAIMSARTMSHWAFRQPARDSALQPRLAAADAGSSRSFGGSPTSSLYVDSHVRRDTFAPASSDLSIPSDQDAYVPSHSSSVGCTQGLQAKSPIRLAITAAVPRTANSPHFRLELPQCEASGSATLGSLMSARHILETLCHRHRLCSACGIRGRSAVPSARRLRSRGVAST